MSGRIVKSPIARVELGGEDWAEVRLRLTYGERAEILERLIDVRVSLATGQPNLSSDRELHHREANIELLLLSLVRWGGPGFCQEEAHPHATDCRPYPITRENIAQLDESADRILAFLEDNVIRRTPDFTKPPSRDGSTAGAEEVRSPDDASSSSDSVAATAGPSRN